MDLDEVPTTSEPTVNLGKRGGDTSIDFRDFDNTDSGPLSGSSTVSSDTLDDDPLARKLELAEEFRQIGDLEGARDLLEEVVAKAGGTLRAKAQAMLDALT
jgi:pilus assembly protein FimV